MIITVPFHSKMFEVDLMKPMDISIPLEAGLNNPNCYWAEPVVAESIVSGDFIGSVKMGGFVNHQKVTITPHGNGTHTECYGHISSEPITLNHCLKTFHFFAQLISVSPNQQHQGDYVISKRDIKQNLTHLPVRALVIRTLPNSHSKRVQNYSGTNPPYLEKDAMHVIVDAGIEHLVVDLPSVDKEQDGGNLAAHKAFWRYPNTIRKQSTITELAFIDDSIPDGFYFLNLQITSLELDASPSKPVLYLLKEVL